MKQQQYYIQINKEPKPFIKWVGGKRQLITYLQKKLWKNMNDYFEPFLGGGALFFNLSFNMKKINFNISDLNPELIRSYIVVRDQVEELIESLQNHSHHYKLNPKSYYYYVRESKPKNDVDLASRLIFLNKTCFNGLYRVNSAGKFNVPLGKYSKPNIVNKENLLNVSSLLQTLNVSIKCNDFFDVYKKIQKNDFIYLDPPYYPLSSTSNFTSYTNNNFKLTDFYRLLDLSEKLHELGCKIMMTNSNTQFILDSFSASHWRILNVQTNRTINSNPKHRTHYSELIITNY